MTAQHNELSTPRQAEATASQFQAAAARIAAHLAGAPGEFARDDIAWLWTELERRQHELAARDADLQRAQAALQMSEARLSLMQEGVNAGIWDWEPQADNVTVTARVESLHGLPSGALQHYQDWRQRIHPDDIERVEAERDAAIAEHRAFAVEFRVDAGDGEMRWIAGRGRAIYNEDGQVVRIVGINQDITERKLAELGLLEERANMQALLENTGGSIWSVDTNYCLIAGNSVFHRDTYAAFGRPFASGDLLLTLDGPSDAIAVWKARYNRALGGETFTVETQRLFGRPVWDGISFQPNSQRKRCDHRRHRLWPRHYRTQAGRTTNPRATGGDHLLLRQRADWAGGARYRPAFCAYQQIAGRGQWRASRRSHRSHGSRDRPGPGGTGAHAGS